MFAGNWQGLKDEECGIHGYTWAVGTKICGSDVVSFRNPHAHLPDRHDWTNTGLARDLHLPDGQYYVTVQVCGWVGWGCLSACIGCD